MLSRSWLCCDIFPFDILKICLIFKTGIIIRTLLITERFPTDVSLFTCDYIAWGILLTAIMFPS